MPCAVSQGEIDWYNNQSKIKEKTKISGSFTEILCQACLHLSCTIMDEIKERDFGTLLDWYAHHLVKDILLLPSDERIKEIVCESNRIYTYKKDKTCTT